MTPDPYSVESFEHFWPHYVRLHTRTQTQWFHALATCACLALLCAGLARESVLLIMLAPVADYLIAQTSHVFFEKNRTFPWKNVVWHTHAELRMFRLVVTRRMAAQVALHASPSIVRRQQSASTILH